MDASTATLRFLFDLEFFGIKAGLSNIRALCSFLGNPERSFPSVHIAGTNGKGSTAAMIASVLTASGYRTGLYTSPHLIDFAERIRIDGRVIPREELVRSTEHLAPLIRKLRATFFEATTAIAFRYFAEKGVDVAVIETGLGGRWDATNVLVPMVSVITNIGLEHTEYLGTTVSRIAFEKGGIIKPSVPCVTGTSQPAALRTLRRLARFRGSELIVADSCSSVAIADRSLDHLRVRLRTPQALYKDLSIGVSGDHQSRNAQLAVLALEHVRDRCGFRRITRGKIIGGLGSIRRNSGLQGRLELVRRTPCVIVDVAHNPDGAMTLSRSLRRLTGGNVLTVFGVLRDKEYASMIRTLAPLSRLTIGVRPGSPRALDTRTILENYHALGARAIDGGTVSEGIRAALREARPDEPVLVTGSHYVVGEALKFLKSTP